MYRLKGRYTAIKKICQVLPQFSIKMIVSNKRIFVNYLTINFKEITKPIAKLLTVQSK